MSRLFKFEIKRMKYKKIHIILPLIIISIGLVGIITGNAFNENLTSKVKMLNIFQAYTQFSFIFLGFVYIYLFTEDSIKGMVDLIFQFCTIDYLNLTSNYLFMFVLIIIMYVPYLYLEKVEKKIWIFILPITLCFFMIYILENEDLFERISMIILIGLFISNLLYLYFFSFTIKNIELQNEKNELYRKLKIAQNNYNNTFDFLHALIHDSHSIDMYFKNKEYEKAKNDFYVMKQEIIEKFNAIYTGNTALSTAICNIDLGNATVQHFVQCNTKEFNDSDLTIFFINTLNNLIEDNEPIIYVSIVDIGLNKVISIKTSLAHDFSTVERDNHRFIKKYNLKVDKEEKKITFLYLNPK